MEHQFTQQIDSILIRHFGQHAEGVYTKSPLLQYLNIKTRSAARGSKSRGSFANLYAIYVLVENYLSGGFDLTLNYKIYEGARYTDLLRRQRELPFGNKLQNHALNHRLNQEFRKYFAQVDYVPILRDVDTNRYWFNENLLRVHVGEQTFNIAQSIINIIDAYIDAKQDAFNSFIKTCESLIDISDSDSKSIKSFILGLLNPNVDARIFEIVSYSILKRYYADQIVYFGFDVDDIKEENLKLYKTGRTNANDGGIDFVMKPLGRFFQVTETLDVRKYFLDIDKIERYPISFVIKSELSVENLWKKLREGAEHQFSISVIVEKYMNAIEEVINIDKLKEYLDESASEEYLAAILHEIILQSRTEFNME